MAEGAVTSEPLSGRLQGKIQGIRTKFVRADAYVVTEGASSVLSIQVY
jgi:hypothetical protein